jgi:hypothetical protein
MSLDLKDQMFVNKDMHKHYRKERAYVSNIKLQLQPKLEQGPSPLPEPFFPYPLQVEAEESPEQDKEMPEISRLPSKMPEEHEAFWRDPEPEKEKQPIPEDQPKDDELQMHVSPSNYFNDKEEHEFQEADLVQPITFLSTSSSGLIVASTCLILLHSPSW